VFPYSEFRDETVQGIDTQIECITGDGFGDVEAQIVQRDIPVAINRSVGVQAEDVFSTLKVKFMQKRNERISDNRFSLQSVWG
jgi:hypothetical protein